MEILSTRPSRNSVILHDKISRRWLYFESPVALYVVDDVSLLPETLAVIEHAVCGNGLHAAGFLAYEAASGINPELSSVHQSPGFPLCWFGLYESPRVIKLPLSDAVGPLAWQPSINEQQYHQALMQIREHIRDGDTYQANYSYRLRAAMNGHGWDLFPGMVAAQQPGYSAFIEMDDWTICSCSPELFFALDGQRLFCRPMKGTASRGLTFSTDRTHRDGLRESVKDRAENLMIVDMVRNDMGRIAHTGKVSVNSLFDIEKYPTLWQLTSSIECRTDSNLGSILQALFPAASITGAPKKRTMEILSQLECSPRNIYTGSIGYYAPGRRAQFNVAIRTVLINKQSQQAEYGVGSGILWDSAVQTEWQETRTKAAVLGYRQPEFSLLESLLWEPGRGYWLLREHLSRLRDSAEYFDFAFDEIAVLSECERFAHGLDTIPYKVRILLDKFGILQINAEPVSARSKPLRITLAQNPVNSSDRFLYHKTTYRKVYEDALIEGFDDVLLFNEKGEITETTMANLVVEIDGHFYTPPVACGLLAGTYRARLLEEGRISERCIQWNELNRITAVYLINSVRGWWQVDLDRLNPG